MTEDKNIYTCVHPENELDTVDTKEIRNVVESKIVRLSIAFYRFHMLSYKYTCQRKYNFLLKQILLQLTNEVLYTAIDLQLA
jgi:hypothetical protein